MITETKKIAFTTLGCRTNLHDTAEMQTLLEQEGFDIVDAQEDADIYVINTCSVTQRSDYNSRLAVKKSLAINEDALVVFTGCYAQLNPEEASQINGLDIVLGNADKLDIADLIKNRLNNDPPHKHSGPGEIVMSDIHSKRAFRTLPVTRFQGKTKAFIKVQTGCEEKCSFCTVVRARGSSASDTRENILNNIKETIRAGFREITLTGINLGTYGMDHTPPETFSSLVRDILALKGEFRVRLSSINPMEIDGGLIRLIAGNEKLCPHLHVPLQSGCDEILSRMRRNYNAQQYIDTVSRAVEQIPGLALGADVIVGFPGETDANFERTRALIESLPFSYLHAFSYSPRKGTEAFDFKNDVPKTIKKARNQVLSDLAREKSLNYQKQSIGQTLTVLIEKHRDPASGMLKGYSQNYIPVLLEGGDHLKNSLVPVTIQDVSTHRVTGFLQS